MEISGVIPGSQVNGVRLKKISLNKDDLNRKLGQQFKMFLIQIEPCIF